MIEDTIEYNAFFLLFSDNKAVVLDIFTLQDKHNIHTLSINIKLICILCKTGKKILPKAIFSTCF